MLSPSPTDRVKPLLGTFVRICVEGLPSVRANEAIHAAFAEIARIHDLMSFHRSESDISRINRHAAYEAVTVDERTWTVLQAALDMAARSKGAFDPCIGDTLVARDLLPAPAPGDGVFCDWRAVELLPGNQVRLHSPAWIDLGGIAKGYAVDRAIDILAGFDPVQACVNAGGDLRVFGARHERTCLNAETEDSALPVVELHRESLASSFGRMAWRGQRDVRAPHVATRQEYEAPPTFVSVIASSCMYADALTKVVLALGDDAAPQLHAFGAHALMRRSSGWLEIAGHP